MKKLLLTGASGFLGSRIVTGYQTKYDIYTPSHDEMNITNKENVLELIQHLEPDYIIHCAAISDVGLCEKEPERSWTINVDGSRYIAEAAKLTGAKCILCSSDQVYFGSKIKGAHAENEILEPFNLYGREKLTAERECLQVNSDCVLLRLSWMYDVETLHAKEHGDFARTLLQKIKAQEAISYPIHDIRGITYVQDVVQKLEAAFHLPGGVYNFGAPNDKNTYEMVAELFRELGWENSKLSKNEEAFANNPRNISMSQEKLNAQGIFFASTVQRLVEVLRRERKGVWNE